MWRQSVLKKPWQIDTKSFTPLKISYVQEHSTQQARETVVDLMYALNAHGRRHHVCVLSESLPDQAGKPGFYAKPAVQNNDI